MYIKLNNGNNGLKMNLNKVSMNLFKPGAPSILFSMNPYLIYENENYICGINSVNTVGKIGYNSQNNSLFIQSGYGVDGKEYYNAIEGENEQMESSITMEDFSFNFAPNTTINIFININAPLCRNIFNGNGLETLRKSKSGNVAFFYDKSGGVNGSIKNKKITIGYKCPYYLDYITPSRYKYNFSIYQFCIGIPNTIGSYIITDLAYTFNTWYMLSLVATETGIKLYVNGVPTKILETGINVVQKLRGNKIHGIEEHNEIPIYPNYLNYNGESVENRFNYEYEYELQTTEIKGYSTGVFNSMVEYSNIKTARRISNENNSKNLNPNTDTGLIEVFNKAMNDSEIANYYSTNNIY